MNKFFNNLNNREKYLIFGAISFAVIALIFIYANRIMNDLNVSEKRLNKAKSDYQYVVSKAELLNSKLINSSDDTDKIESYIKDIFSIPSSDLKVEYLNKSLMISIKAKNLQEAIIISDEITITLNRKLKKVSYTNLETQSLAIMYY
jgi:Flp pilus assembly secretin CpaC|tara:strand:- start:81 stop:521 length:441 start_codon:yes stop_codon:yes gene_type:complete